jgi:hypothetical protein
MTATARNTSDVANSSVYASVKDATNNELHLIVLNKSFDDTQNASIQIAGSQAYTSGSVYGFNGSNTSLSQAGTISNISGNQFTYSIPPLTAYHIVLKPGSSTVTVPSAPMGLTAAAGNAQAVLSWTASNGATSYNVKRATTSGGAYTTVATGVTGTTYTNTGLTNGTTYYYVVSAVNIAGESVNSAQANATPVGSTTTPSGLVVQYKLNNSNANDNTIYATFNIKNTGTTAVSLSSLKLRYYITKETTSTTLNFWTDWAQVGSNNVSGSFGSVSPAKTNADTYLEISFSSAAGSIAPGSQSGEIQVRIAKSDWSNFSESNDYSFDGTKSSFADWNKVTLYNSGTLVWGIEP